MYVNFKNLKAVSRKQRENQLTYGVMTISKQPLILCHPNVRILNGNIFFAIGRREVLIKFNIAAKNKQQSIFENLQPYPVFKRLVLQYHVEDKREND